MRYKIRLSKALFLA